MDYRVPMDPVRVTALIPEVRAELLRVLRGLSDEQWERDTVCTGWTVRDIAQHLLADDIGLLSNLRDGDGQYFEFESFEALVKLINAQNDLWVRATRRISRRLLLDLLAFTGAQIHEMFLALDPVEAVGPIGWAGPGPDPRWLHIARELTEYWMHHQHVCEAVGITSLREARYTGPVLRTFVHALPQAYVSVDAPEDTLVVFKVSGEGAGEWHLVREADGWRLYAETGLTPTALVRMDVNTAWRMFTKNVALVVTRQNTVIEGDQTLGAYALNAVALLA